MSEAEAFGSEPAARGVRLSHIKREVRHAHATTWSSGDSWIRGYAEDCAWLLAELEEAETALHDLTAEVHAREPMPGGTPVPDE